MRWTDHNASPQERPAAFGNASFYALKVSRFLPFAVTCPRTQSSSGHLRRCLCHWAGHLFVGFVFLLNYMVVSVFCALYMLLLSLCFYVRLEQRNVSF